MKQIWQAKRGGEKVGNGVPDGKSIILFPQYAELSEEVQKLRTELSLKRSSLEKRKVKGP